MILARLILVVLGTIGQSNAVNVATQSQESREVFTLEELNKSLHAPNVDNKITEHHLNDVEKLLESAGIPSPSDMHHLDDEEKKAFATIKSLLGESNAKLVAYVASIAESMNANSKGDNKSAKNVSGSLLEHIATVLKSLPEDFDYAKIEQALGKWMATLPPTRSSPNEGEL